MTPLEDSIIEVVIEARRRLLANEDRSEILRYVLTELHILSGMYGEPWYPES